ncbi:hypothetical protein M413DRAFT_31290 [Hebeloma cylindrosporum]|uniref:Uncharacterized protein n=1 Tax=Hebeloma cylindrosporum TaxID=76867 RepID=A0A0C2XG55_HEBCY|nr:hypothetical protein M413DRAFT_31290 [Hebeloma cylindrosporum h7]
MGGRNSFKSQPFGRSFMNYDKIEKEPDLEPTVLVGDRDFSTIGSDTPSRSSKARPPESLREYQQNEHALKRQKKECKQEDISNSVRLGRAVAGGGPSRRSFRREESSTRPCPSMVLPAALPSSSYIS